MSTDLAKLRESVELETRADLCAASHNLRDAVAYMRAANKLRQEVFGRVQDPNELRDRTREALEAET